MNLLPVPSPTRWFTSPQFFRIAACVFLGVVAVEGYFAIFERRNDYLVHANTGSAFLQGDPYRNGLFTYPLARIMMNSVLALGNERVTRTICYLLGVLALAASYKIWCKLADYDSTAPSRIVTAAGIGTAILYFPYILRDFDECGLQLYLLFMLSAAGLALAYKKNLATGFFLGTAIQYKVAPILFLPFLVYKGKWRAAGFTVLFVGLWALAPALYLGWDTSVEGHKLWAKTVSDVGKSKDAYPHLPGIEPPKPQNLSLLAAIARYLETYPEGHPLHLDHPGFRQFGNLDQKTAYYSVRGIILALGLVMAWVWRRRWNDSNQDLAREWAVVCMFTTLLAPQCWKQHLVLLLPAGFLYVRHTLANLETSRWRLLAMGFIAAVVLLTRHSILGRDTSVLLLSYKLDTIAAMLLLLLTVTLPRRKSGNLLSQLPGIPLNRAA